MTSFSDKFFFTKEERSWGNTNDSFFFVNENQNIVVNFESQKYFTVTKKGEPVDKNEFFSRLDNKFSQYKNAGEILDNFDTFLRSRSTKFIKQTWRQFEIFTNKKGERYKHRRAQKGGEFFMGKFFKPGTFMSREKIK